MWLRQTAEEAMGNRDGGSEKAEWLLPAMREVPGEFLGETQLRFALLRQASFRSFVRHEISPSNISKTA